MKKFLILLSVAVLVCGFSGMANALSGTYMFTMEGNDSNTPEADIEAMINAWFADQGITHDSVDLELYDKVDTPEEGTPPSKAGDHLTVNYVWDGDESKSGTWTTDTAVEFYSVKAGSKNGAGFAFYWLGEGGVTTADWTTAVLENKGLSHLSVWNTTGGGSETPEPATMLLLGSGLVGLVGLKRRKNS